MLAAVPFQFQLRNLDIDLRITQSDALVYVSLQ